MSQQIRKRYDIIINGGGIVGFTLLNLIRNSPHLQRCKVLLIEQAAKPANFKQPPRLLDSNQDDIEWNTTDSREHLTTTFSNRVSSITPSSRKVFERLGVWKTLENYSKGVKKIRVWNYSYSHSMTFKQRASDDTVFSVIENNRLSIALLNNLHKKSSDQSILWESELKHVEQSQDQGLIDVEIENSKSSEGFVASAPLILGCDGYNSKVRQIANIESRKFKLDKMAVVGTVKMDSSGQLQKARNETAFQRFSAEHDTVAALLPLDNQYSSFVISAPEQYAKHLIACDDESFISEFNRLLSAREHLDNPILKGLHSGSQAISDKLHSSMKRLVPNLKPSAMEYDPDGLEEPPRLESVVGNSRATFPLITQLAVPKMIASLPGNHHNQVALLGDSSHRIHPLAGQGLNLGVQDAASLVRLLEESAAYGEKVFDEQDLTLLSKVLGRYNLSRQAYILPMVAGIHSMPLLFKLVPSELVSFVDRIDPLKSTFVKFASG